MATLLTIPGNLIDAEVTAVGDGVRIRFGLPGPSSVTVELSEDDADRLSASLAEAASAVRLHLARANARRAKRAAKKGGG